MPRKMTSFPGRSPSRRVKEKWNGTREFMESTHRIFIHLALEIYLSGRSFSPRMSASSLPHHPSNDRASKNGKLPDALKKDYGYDAISATRTN